MSSETLLNLVRGIFGVGKDFRRELKVAHFEVFDFEFVVDLFGRALLQISLLNDQMTVIKKGRVSDFARRAWQRIHRFPWEGMRVCMCVCVCVCVCVFEWMKGKKK